MLSRRPVVALAFAGLLLAGAPAVHAEPAPGMRFGMSMDDVDALTALGAKPSLGMMWVGAWMQTSDWSHIDALLKHAAATGTTPVIQFWYWGDSISPRCIEEGCDDPLHAQRLSKEGWDALTEALASRIEATMGGREVIVIVEGEFNKAGVDEPAYAPTFDAHLAERMATLHRVAGVKTAIGFGNWGHERWENFPKAVAASDLLGFQTMRGSTRESPEQYATAIESVKVATERLHARFGKPVLLTDLALSSHPEAPFADLQAAQMAELFARRDELARAGLVGVVYRGLADHPHMDLANYYGEAERHWGLQKADGAPKPALRHWLDGVAAAPAAPAAPEEAPLADAPAPRALWLTLSRTGDERQVHLTWSRTSEGLVDIWRDCLLVARTPDGGFHTETTSDGHAHAYRVCDAGTAVCSEELRVEPSPAVPAG